MTLACLNLVCVWAIRRQMSTDPSDPLVLVDGILGARPEAPPSPSPEETDVPKEEIYPTVCVMTWMMEGLEKRLKEELCTYVKELFLQARIEKLLQRWKP